MKNIEIGSQHLTGFRSESQAAFSVPEGNMWINNVFGINDKGAVPSRFLSGFLSTFSLAKTIQELSDNRVNPHVRIFRPVNLSRFVNGISEESAKKQIEQGNQLLDLLALQHFPTVDFSIEEDVLITDDAIKVLSQIEQVMKLHLDEAFIQRLRTKGRIRGGEQGEKQSIFYTAQHPFGWSDLNHPSVFAEFPAETIINTCPPSEKDYTEARQGIREIIGSNSTLSVPNKARHELVINMCGKAHYVFIEDALGNKVEPSFDEILSVTCMEVIKDIKQRQKVAKDSGNSYLADDFRRAAQDLERTFLVFAKGNPDALREETVGSLIGKGEL
jgi:hypothetical protein